MWHDDYITEIEQDASASWWPLIWIIAAIWASIIWFAYAVWGVV